jgi:predicted DNA-binding protein with PD1-like motif
VEAGIGHDNSSTIVTLITQVVLAKAAIDVGAMSAAQKVQLADEIYARQPNLLASVLVLTRYGVSAVQLEVPIHVLLVTYQAIKLSGHMLPTISEDVQEVCLQRLTATVRFTEGVPPKLVDQMIQRYCDEHPERYLLAFVYGHLGEHRLLGARNEAEKYLLLAALNLVECVAFAAAQL